MLRGFFFYYLRQRRLCFRLGLSVCLLVCMSVSKSYFHETWLRGVAWASEEPVTFWSRSQSRCRLTLRGGGICAAFTWWRKNRKFYGGLLCSSIAFLVFFLFKLPWKTKYWNNLTDSRFAGLSFHPCKLGEKLYLWTKHYPQLIIYEDWNIAQLVIAEVVYNHYSFHQCLTVKYWKYGVSSIACRCLWQLDRLFLSGGW